MKNAIIILLIIFSFNAKSQLTYPSIYNEMYYNAYLNYTENEKEYLESKYNKSYLQNLGILYSFVGKYKKSIEYYNSFRKEQGNLPEILKQVDLSSYGINQKNLNELYEKYNVTMFNESHHFSQHRAFISSQLEKLKSLGYTQLALEALSENDSSLIERKYPVKKTGYYTNDPVYGNLIRKAIEIGFTLIHYDVPKMLGREKNQAKNIFKQYNPQKGKLVIYGGYGHISETGGYKMMGQHLNNMLKEDLLTISQFTKFSIEPVFPSDSEFDFFLKKDSEKQFDYYFYAKPKRPDSNIPYWYSWMNFKTKPLNEIYNKTIKYPTLVQLHNINEEKAVPVYQYLIDKEEDVLIAYPKEGEYILKIIDKIGETEYKINLKK